MSLKTDLKDIKDEFNKDEKILESAFRLEILWRRYRKYIILLILCMFGIGIGWIINDYMVSKRAEEASLAYAKLAEDATDKEALQSLKKSSPALYDLYRYSNAHGDIAVYESLIDSKNEFVRTLARYEVASYRASSLLEKTNNQDSYQAALAQNLESLEKTTSSSLKDLAILQEAYLLFQAHKPQEAQQKLKLISESSPLYREAMMLKHFGLRDKPSS